MGNALFWWDLILITEAVLVAMGGWGYWEAKHHRGKKHQYVMTAASTVVFFWISTYMVMAIFNGYAPFGGPKLMYFLVFIPLILIHSMLSTIALFLTGAAVWSGIKGKRKVGKKNQIALLPGFEGTRHRKVGTLTLWFFGGSAVTAYIAYFLLFVVYHPPVS